MNGQIAVIILVVFGPGFVLSRTTKFGDTYIHIFGKPVSLNKHLASVLYWYSWLATIIVVIAGLWSLVNDALTV